MKLNGENELNNNGEKGDKNERDQGFTESASSAKNAKKKLYYGQTKRRVVSRDAEPYHGYQESTSSK